MANFGWSYPPGCNSVPGDEDDPPCECCGGDSADCECPECPVCEEVGNPNCYFEHGLELAPWQIKGLEVVLDEEYANCLDNRTAWDESLEWDYTEE
jgi:hypothetical protein